MLYIKFIISSYFQHCLCVAWQFQNWQSQLFDCFADHFPPKNFSLVSFKHEIDEPGAPSLRKLAPCLPKPNCVPTSPHPPNLTSDPPKGHCGHNQNHLETRTAGKSTTLAMYPFCNNMQQLLHSFWEQNMKNISIQLSLWVELIFEPQFTMGQNQTPGAVELKAKASRFFFRI